MKMNSAAQNEQHYSFKISPPRKAGRGGQRSAAGVGRDTVSTKKAVHIRWTAFHNKISL